jgi:hypothetical protein
MALAKPFSPTVSAKLTDGNVRLVCRRFRPTTNRTPTSFCVDYVAIEMSCKSRNRADKHHRQRPVAAVTYARLSANLADVDLSKVSAVEKDDSKAIVACSKHLCGAATGRLKG